MAKTIYSHELRTLHCPNCGAPVDVALSGGTAKCTYCGTSHTVARRDESADIQQAKQAPPMGESERLGMLRSQDASPQPLPAGLENYVTGYEIRPEVQDHALKFWQMTRQQVQQGAPFPDQDRLYFLTILLARVVDDRTRRPLLESALELLPDVRHRQVLRCSLAENAVLAGDVEAARQWLRPCNPRPTDLQMDTAYRVAAGCLAAAERDYSQVLSLLGTRPGDVPLADQVEAKAELLRTHGIERTQGAQVATQQLTYMMLRDPRRLHGFQHAVKELESLELCPQSGAVAAQTVWQALEARLRPAPVGNPKTIFAGCVIPIGGLVLAIAGGLGLISPHLAVRINLMVHPLIWLVAVPGVVILVIYHVRKKKRELRERGQLGWARVVSSNRRIRRTQNTTTVVQDISIQVLLGNGQVPISKTLTRDDPVPLGVYPCFVDPQDPENAEIQLKPLQ